MFAIILKKPNELITNLIFYVVYKKKTVLCWNGWNIKYLKMLIQCIAIYLVCTSQANKGIKNKKEMEIFVSKGLYRQQIKITFDRIDLTFYDYSTGKISFFLFRKMDTKLQLDFYSLAARHQKFVVSFFRCCCDSMFQWWVNALSMHNLYYFYRFI